MTIWSGHRIYLYEYHVVSGTEKCEEIYCDKDEVTLQGKLSPDGAHIALIQSNHIVLLHLSEKFDARTALTKVIGFRSGEGLYCGIAEYVAVEEMNRQDGLWWSPDGSFLLFTVVNESMISFVNIPPNEWDGGINGHQVDLRYPFAGMIIIKFSSIYRLHLCRHM